MFSETINQLVEKGRTKNWYDFFFACILLYSVGYYFMFHYPWINLHLAFFTLGTFALMWFLVFQRRENLDGNS